MTRPFRTPARKMIVILVSVLAAVCYGVIHDQITAHLCVEYFTVAHPPLSHSQSPTVLAFCWGVVATSGIGVILGVILAEVSQSAGRTPYSMAALVRSVLLLLAAMGLAAFAAGVAGFELSKHGVIRLPTGYAMVIPPQRYNRFMAVWFAHCASYLVGLTGGGYLVCRIWRERGRPHIISFMPRTKVGAVRAVVVVAVACYVVYVRFFRT